MLQIGQLWAEKSSPPDFTAAQRWYERAAQTRDSTAMEYLAVLFEFAFDPPDMAMAQHWRDRAAQARATTHGPREAGSSAHS